MANHKIIEMDSVREYVQEYPVELALHGAYNRPQNRLCVIAYNHGRDDKTAVDLLQLLEWLKAERPELLEPSAQVLKALSHALWRYAGEHIVDLEVDDPEDEERCTAEIQQIVLRHLKEHPPPNLSATDT